MEIYYIIETRTTVERQAYYGITDSWREFSSDTDLKEAQDKLKLAKKSYGDLNDFRLFKVTRKELK